MEKKKYKRRVVGSVLKNKDKPGSYIKMREDVVLKKDQILRLESAKQQIESAEAAGAAGKLSEEIVEKIRERVSKIPAFVLFEIVVTE